ncbi:MAG: hypothetical protein ABI175_21800, partial [Polyangiales bacterium]
ALAAPRGDRAVAREHRKALCSGTMMRERIWGVLLCVAAFVVPACDRKTDTNGSGGASSAAVGPAIDKAKEKAKEKANEKPKAKPADAKKTAAKGGEASKDKPPAKDAKKAHEATQKEKKKVDSAESAACDDVPDGAAACGGDNLFLCIQKDLYAVDCNALAKSHGFETGACFETETQVDCLGCMKLDDGSTACCSADEGYCCDGDGFCWPSSP